MPLFFSKIRPGTRYVSMENRRHKAAIRSSISRTSPEAAGFFAASATAAAIKTMEDWHQIIRGIQNQMRLGEYLKRHPKIENIKGVETVLDKCISDIADLFVGRDEKLQKVGPGLFGDMMKSLFLQIVYDGCPKQYEKPATKDERKVPDLIDREILEKYMAAVCKARPFCELPADLVRGCKMGVRDFLYKVDWFKYKEFTDKFKDGEDRDVFIMYRMVRGVAGFKAWQFAMAFDRIASRGYPAGLKAVVTEREINPSCLTRKLVDEEVDAMASEFAAK
jgi:hypothetical protein